VKKTEMRYESDSMGEVAIPQWAYWGAQTQRAVNNFSVSPLKIPKLFLKAQAYIKKHAAKSNAELGLVDGTLVDAIVKSCDEILEGLWDDHFPIDVFQTGSGTSWNMNINEVIANRSNELLGSERGTRSPVHPNDHVNRGQSSNDTIPTALHIANRLALIQLFPALQKLAASFRKKENEFSRILKLGRTHLQDAVPMTLGQEFGAYAVQIEKAIQRIQYCIPDLEELALGGTAVGTGINAHKDFAQKAIAGIADETGIPFKAAADRFEAIATRDAQVALMGALNGLATALMKIANDLRLLASGPRGMLGEIVLPSLQPGSSIMPGKVNPVIPEMVIQVAAHINGKAVSTTIAGQNSPLELNMMHPLLAYETLSSIELLSETCINFSEKCIDGISADEKRCSEWIEWSLALVTPLANKLGYDKATELAYQAYKQKRKIRDVVSEAKLLSEEDLDDLLDPSQML
jgi:fumarate hydratase class II